MTGNMTTTAVAQISQETMDKMQANFTKQLEAMQTLMNQTLDTRLNSLSEALILENKEIRQKTEHEMNALKAEITALQTYVKIQKATGGDRSPRPSVV